MKISAFRIQVITFLIFALVVFAASSVNAQDDPFEIEYRSIFDFQEEDLYINSSIRQRHYSEENTYFTGNLNGYSIPSPPKRESSNEYGVPDPPPPPDVPINSYIVYLIILGFVFGVVKLFFLKIIKEN